MRTFTALAASVMLALAACGGSDSGSDENATMIDWDLTNSHTVDDVDWPKPDLSAVEIAPVGTVEIALPEGRAFKGDGEDVHDVTMDRRDEVVRNLQIDSHPRSPDEAHRLAVRWASDWGLSREPLDEWRDGEKKTPVITSGPIENRIGQTGPLPTVEIRNSFRDDRPALVSLQFYWPD